MSFNINTSIFRYILPIVLGGIFLYGGMHMVKDVEYDAHATSTFAKTAPKNGTSSFSFLGASTSAPHNVKPEIVITHLKTPIPLKAAYMTSCIASGKKLRAPLVKLIDDTELNGVVIDIKDFSGAVSIDTGDPRFVVNKNGCSIPDIKEFIQELHEKNIYVIG